VPDERFLLGFVSAAGFVSGAFESDGFASPLFDSPVAPAPSLLFVSPLPLPSELLVDGSAFRCAFLP